MGNFRQRDWEISWQRLRSWHRCIRSVHLCRDSGIDLRLTSGSKFLGYVRPDFGRDSARRGLRQTGRFPRTSLSCNSSQTPTNINIQATKIVRNIYPLDSLALYACLIFCFTLHSCYRSRSEHQLLGQRKSLLELRQYTYAEPSTTRTCNHGSCLSGDLPEEDTTVEGVFSASRSGALAGPCHFSSKTNQDEAVHYLRYTRNVRIYTSHHSLIKLTLISVLCRTFSDV